MKKYILTESQIKRVVDRVLNEQNTLTKKTKMKSDSIPLIKSK